jgi:hypothetical protein
MTAKFLHVGFSFRGGRSVPTDSIQTVLNKALDWVRYAPNCYILYTTTDVETWYVLLRKVIHEKDHIFIVELNIENREGWLPKSVWEWIRKDRSD